MSIKFYSQQWTKIPRARKMGVIFQNQSQEEGNTTVNGRKPEPEKVSKVVKSCPADAPWSQRPGTRRRGDGRHSEEKWISGALGGWGGGGGEPRLGRRWHSPCPIRQTRGWVTAGLINQLVPSEPLLSFLSRLCTSSPGASKTFVPKAAGRNKLAVEKQHTTHIINVYIIHIHRHTYAHTHICDKFHKILSTFTCGMC